MFIIMEEEVINLNFRIPMKLLDLKIQTKDNRNICFRFSDEEKKNKIGSILK